VSVWMCECRRLRCFRLKPPFWVYGGWGRTESGQALGGVWSFSVSTLDLCFGILILLSDLVVCGLSVAGRLYFFFLLFLFSFLFFYQIVLGLLCGILGFAPGWAGFGECCGQVWRRLTLGRIFDVLGACLPGLV